MEKTVLDEFAMVAMGQIMAGWDTMADHPDRVAILAYEYAEAMVREKLKRETMADFYS